MYMYINRRFLSLNAKVHVYVVLRVQYVCHKTYDHLLKSDAYIYLNFRKINGK